MLDDAVPFCDAFRRIFQKAGGGDAAPLRVGRREMAAYVTFRQSAKQGVDQGVYPHVRVTVAGQAPIMRDAYAAKP